MKTGLQLIDLTIHLGLRRIARVTADIPPGQVLTVMGPSGAGKSTLLAALTGTLDPAFQMTGRIVLNGHDITHQPTRLRRIGLLFQDDLLLPHLTVAGNLAFALPPDIRPRAARDARIAAALTEMELSDFGPRNPATLSGGQRARVALARCLISNPLALALDEPFSRLDATLRAQIRTLVFAHARSRALPVILVTHDPEDAAAAGGPVISPDI
ncbi:MAG: ATP-binding cassette domain-containing protein [Candidatus Saccharibacteria bacterium]|nr:ATP-binding cassette domain-containing protein [Pseudorhodobacter sp.]